VSHEPIRIAEAAAADIPAIAQFLWNAWAEAGPDAPGWIGADEDVVAQIAAPDSLRARLGGPRRRMFLAWRGDDVVGFSATRMVDDQTIELAGIVVLHSMAGGGVGTPLVEAAAASARDHSYARMITKTESSNERALAFYENCGFTRTGALVEEVGATPVDLVALERVL
jgi:ribosomal protein S18 acetylase RimI-like enzyme